MSPFSVLMLLAIAADATAGGTRNEILKALSGDIEYDDIINLICKIQSVLTESHAFHRLMQYVYSTASKIP